jgi:hypothetical protein
MGNGAWSMEQDVAEGVAVSERGAETEQMWDSAVGCKPHAAGCVVRGVWCVSHTSMWDLHVGTWYTSTTPACINHASMCAAGVPGASTVSASLPAYKHVATSRV